MTLLPPELVREILSFLGQKDLRVAASVSRSFHASAWRAGLIFRRTFTWDWDKNCADELASLSELVHHSVSKNLRLTLTLTLRENENSDSRIYPMTLGPPVSEVLRLISLALPILVTLSLKFTRGLFTSVAKVLSSQSAPQLHALHLGVLASDGISVPEVQPAIFAGCSPKLRVLLLDDIRIGRGLVVAFEPVQALTLMDAALSPDLVIVQQFPALRTLFLSQQSVAVSPFAAMPRILRGLQLERLVIHESVAPTLAIGVLSGDKPVDIPSIEYICDSVEWTESIWHTTNDGLFNIRLTAYSPPQTRDVTIFVVPEHRRWYRGYNVHNWLPSLGLPVADLPRLTERLSYLRMDNYYIIGFLECTDLAFHALVDIQIDFDERTAHFGMVWPPDWIDAFPGCVFPFTEADGSVPTFSKASHRYVNCAALKTLRLFAIYSEMSVASQEVAYLGRALSQCPRPKHARAALELHGMNFREPTSHALIDGTFSAVVQHGFTGWDGPVGRDSGVWDNWYV